MNQLRRLEEEAIFLLRETASLFRRPVMLYSIGKDSTVLAHLAAKAFWPARPPFPLLHIDTTWKFREMIAFRDRLAGALGFDLSVHVNRDGVAQGVTPFSADATTYTRVMKTEALKQALAQGGYDAAIGGARRDEEKSRAKERMVSLRSAQHGWEPRSQRPEFWRVVNPHMRPGETMRVFPLSNWSERDVWRYTLAEGIPTVPLYLASPRPVVRRDGALVVTDDERFPLRPGEIPEMRSVRFRSLGCYPLCGAVESEAASIGEIVAELEATTTSERHGRLIDGAGAASMEAKKREGYF
ncbi:MAG TPA: sulfate adenylyltransferase subunit CysD [Bosea sp. (in: a-proteobacteria)]|uniref:sulfate adenylyltransferase subunit CysD n=1 Tax=Bosea sp. (in: a-proteobacteria) TaxID=1871050 RepID=UPI002E0F3BEF|nr:sulfate adenylyltransferase subunit CysD [Bosea sp. (in: a-proteobacteria)]